MNTNASRPNLKDKAVDRPHLRPIETPAQSTRAIIFIHGGWSQNWGIENVDDNDLIDALRRAGWKESIYHFWWDSSEGFALHHIESIKSRAKRVGTTYFSNLVSSRIAENEISILSYSFGARVAYYALESWSAQHSLGDVILLGGAIKRDSSKKWGYVASRLNGQLINIYNKDDPRLNELHYYQGGTSPCGRKPIKEKHFKIVNRDATDFVGKHHSLGRYLKPLYQFKDWSRV